MAPQDYACRERTIKPGRKKAVDSRKKFFSVFTLRLLMVVFVLLAFIFVLLFFSHNNKEIPVLAPTLPLEKPVLPPEPQERWRYIKELQQQQTLPLLPENETFDHLKSHTNNSLLVDEQRQLLEKMKADIQRQEPTLLEEVPWNAPTSLDKKTMINENSDKKAIINEKPSPSSPLPATAPSVSRWHLQCGAFKQKSAAESLKARLALEGIESRIHKETQWYRLQIGSFRKKIDGEPIRKQLAVSLKINCHFQASES